LSEINILSTEMLQKNFQKNLSGQILLKNIIQ